MVSKNKGAKHGLWKGDNPISYSTLHSWLVRNYGKANICENKNCSSTTKTFDWALIHGKEYIRRREHFMALCRSCHIKYDFTEERRKKQSLVQSGSKNGFWNRKHSVESLAKMRIAKLGKICSEETKQKMREAHQKRLYGKT